MPFLERLRGGVAPRLLYPLLALLSFPTFGQLIAGEHGLGYVLDVFELPRTGIFDTWPEQGLALWNPHLTGGNALLAQQANAPFALDVAVGLFAGPFVGYAVMAWAMAALAGVSMHLFLRDSLRLSTAAVVGGATMFLFSFWIFIYGAAALALPLMLWLTDRASSATPTRWRYVAGGGVIGALLLYDGLSQIVAFTALVQLAWAVLAAEAGQRRSRVGAFVVAWSLAGLLFAPVLVTQLVMLPISQRTIWDLRDLYDPRPLEAVADTIRHYSATFLGVPVGDGFGTSPARYGTYFAGAAGLPLLVAGLVFGRRSRRTWLVVGLLLSIPIIDLVGLLLTPLQDQLGFLKSFQVVRIRHVYAFAMAATVAVGLDAVIGWLAGDRRESSARWRSRWRWALVTLSVLPILVTGLVALGQVVRRRRDLFALDPTAVGWALALLALLVGALLIVGVTAVAIRARRGQVLHGTGIVVLAALILMAGERAIYAHGERLIGSYIGTWASILAPTPGQRFLLDQPGIQTERVLSFGGDANRMGAAGMNQADGTQAIYPLAYHRFFGALIDPQLDTDPASATYFRSWGNRAITFGPLVDPELVALAGVRWLSVDGDEVPTVPGIAARFQEGTTTIYEVPSALPRAFLVERLAVHPNAEATIDALAAASLADLRATAYVAEGPDAATTRAGLTPGSSPPTDAADGAEPGLATIATYRADRVEIDVLAERASILVLTDVMAPGWVAERDGVEVPIATVDGAFRGVGIEPSTRRVVFRYVPGLTYVGFGLAGMGLGLLLLTAWLLRRHDRAIDA